MPELTGRQTSGITVLGVLSVVLGLFFFVCSVWGLLLPPTLHATLEQAGAPEVLTGSSVTGAYVNAMVNVLLAAALFVAGAGLLQLRKWGATLARAYAFARIGWSVVAVLLAWFGPYANARALPAFPEPHATFMAHSFPAVVITQLVAGFVLTALFPVVLLCLLSRTEYKNTLR